MHETLFGLDIGNMAEPVALIGWSMVGLTALCARPLGFGARWLACVAVTAIYFFACSPVGANFLIGKFEQSATDAAKRCDAPAKESVFIVLGGGVSGAPRDARDYARLQEDSFRRLIAAVELAGRVPSSVLLLSGGGARGGVSQAELMAAMAQALGVPAARLTVERQSETTFEQARNIGRMLGAQDQRPRYLVTSALHMPRALATFAASGVAVCALPVDFRHVSADWYESLVPQLTALTKTSDVMHEALGYLAYLLTGKIKW